MKVFKFGGASINSVERIRNIPLVLKEFTGEPLLLVISAMGKMTNSLEHVVENFFRGNKEAALGLFGGVKEAHLKLARELLSFSYDDCSKKLVDFYTEVEWLLHDKPQRDYDYYYDQVVCCGELLSSAILSYFLDESGIKNKWVDVRDIIRTDDNFRDAAVDWDYTREKIIHEITPLYTETSIVITQGFIGATDENESTTLGREGSDYSAAVFANLLEASALTIWKDVESVMNADPKQFPDAIPIPQLNYNEVIEMAYYGAQVIHPKTIKPLQNKNIPLYVKCFLDPSLPGTVIHTNPVHHLPPIIVLKENQVRLDMSSTDFSFIGEHHVGKLYELFGQLRIRPNLTQNTAINFICVMDDKPDKIESLALEASEFLEVRIQKGLTLLTIRHYTDEIIQKMTAGKKILLKQQTENTMQVLMVTAG